MTAYDYYPAVLYALDKLSQGMTRTRACDEANISVQVFEAYLRKDDTLQEMYIEAERRGHDALADALLSPDNHVLYGQTNPQMAKVMSDNIKWLLSKRDQKRFGEKIEIKHEITLDRAITDAMHAARQRVEGAVIEYPVELQRLAPPTMDYEDAEIIVDEDAELLAELLT